MQGIGLLEWDPKSGGWTLPKSQETALAARTKAAKQAEQDVADAGKADTYTFGSGLNARPIQTTAAIANALRTGVAPDVETATKAGQIAQKFGHDVRISIRGERGQDLQTGDLGKGYQTPASAQGSGSVPGERPSPQEEANIEGRKKFIVARTEGAANYEKGLNEAVVTGQELMSRMQEQKDAMTKFKTGGGGETRAKLAQMAQAAGMPEKVVNGIAGGDLGAMQEFNKLAVAGAMKSLQQSMQNLQGTGAGRITQKAIDKIFQFTEKMYQRSYDEQQGFNKWVKEGNEPADFQAEFAQRMDSEFKRKNLRAITDSSPPGSSAPRRYNPATGKIE